jgi:acetyltransferase-like isoleucine patch superfamily enzyme
MDTIMQRLGGWGIPAEKVAMMYEPENSSRMIQAFGFSEADRWCNFTGKFGPNCYVHLDPANVENCGKLQVSRSGNMATPIDDIHLIIMKSHPSLTLRLGSPGARMCIGNFGTPFYAIANVWRRSVMCIGDNATSNGANFILDNSELIIGRDTMLSSDIVIQCSDQHGIIDLETGLVINNRRTSVTLAEHVWIGRRAMILPDVSIGKGSIIGAGALVTRDVGAFSLAVGSPARVIRCGVSWSRSPDGLNDNECSLLADQNG